MIGEEALEPGHPAGVLEEGSLAPSPALAGA